MKIILKSDDFCGNSYSLTSKWGKFFTILKENNAKTSVGVIGKECNKLTPVQIKELKELCDSNVISFYNHSYNHIEKKNEWEFSGSSMQYQRNSLEENQALIENYFGYKMRCFGAPQNAIADYALILLNNHKDLTHIYVYQNSTRIKAILNGLKNKTLIYLNGYGYLEHKEESQSINYKRFIQKFSEIEELDLVTFQMHPNSWNEKDLEELDKIIKFLNSKNCEFIFPRDL